MKKLEKKPFALVGVNVNPQTPQALKKVMEKENLSWRSVADQGASASKWPVSGTPTFYVIDPKGVIRHKWVGNPGEKAIDSAIDRLLQELGPGLQKDSR